MKRSTKIIIGVVVLVIIAIITTVIIMGKDADLTEVEVGNIERADLVSRVTANGKIEAKRKVDLSANVMGQVINLAVREGERVDKGNFLLQIAQAQLAASAAGAQASLQAILADRDASRAAAQEAFLAFERARKSYEDNLVPRAELERAQAALDSSKANVVALERRIEQARASLDGARDTLSKTTIRAPMDGIVTALLVEEGEVAVIGTMNNPGTILLTISDMSVVEAVMDVDETDVPSVRIGQLAEVTIDAFPDERFTGKVTEVASSPRSSMTATDAVNFEVKIQLDEPPPDVRPGFSASADIITGRTDDVVAVPIQALVIRDVQSVAGTKASAKGEEEEGVYVVDRSTRKVSFRKLVTGITGEASIGVSEGVEPGEEIVVGPFRALREIEDGDEVRIIEPKEGEKGGRTEENL